MKIAPATATVGIAVVSIAKLAEIISIRGLMVQTQHFDLGETQIRIEVRNVHYCSRTLDGQTTAVQTLTSSYVKEVHLAVVNRMSMYILGDLNAGFYMQLQRQRVYCFHQKHSFAEIGDCISNPCLGGATCLPEVNGGFTCLCPVGIFGNTCEEAQLNGFSYSVFGERKSWSDARDDCLNRGLVLTSIVNKDAHNLLKRFVR